MDRYKLIIVLLSLLLVIIPSVLIRLLNVGKKERYKQFRYPVLSVIYLISSCITQANYNAYANNLLNSPIAQTILNYLSPSGKLDYVILVYSIIIGNAIVLCLFLGIKFVTKIGIKKKKLPAGYGSLHWFQKPYWFFVRFFYDIENGSGTVYTYWVKVAYTLKCAYWVLASVYLLLILFFQIPVFSTATWIPYDFMAENISKFYIWPAVSLIVINEIRWFLDGKTPFEKPEKMMFDQSVMVKHADYGSLATQYELQFPERFCKYISCNAQNENHNFYNETAGSSEFEKAIAKQLRRRGYEVNEDFLTCINKLNENMNALIDASVFSDFGDYLFIYLNTLLASGENVLFLCADDKAAQIVGNHINDKFKTMNNFHKIWILREGDDVHGYADADILVMTPQFLLDSNAFVGQTLFFERLSTCIICNTAEVIAKDGVLLALLAHKLTNIVGRRKDGKKLRYICLSESLPPETSNSLKQILNLKDDLYVCDAYHTFDNTHLLLWNYESGESSVSEEADKNKSTLIQDNLFGDRKTQTYWGVSLPLACVALKYHVEKISIISYEGTPYIQILDSMKNHVSRMNEYFRGEIGFTDFDNRILLNKVDNEDRHTAFLVVEDTLFNLPLAIYNYCRYGGSDTSMIHIVSKPYMLRDYFMDNAADYLRSESQVNMIMPALSDTKQIVVAKFLCEALDGGIECDDFLARMMQIDPEVKDIGQALEICKELFFPGRKDLPVEYYFGFFEKTVFNKKNVEFETKQMIKVKVATSIEALLKKAKQAQMELRGERFNIGVYSNCLNQHFVPEQCFEHNGHLYIIEAIDAQNGVIKVKEAGDHLNSPVDYIQVRKYKLEGEPRISRIMPVQYDKSVRRNSTGYEIKEIKHSAVSVDTIGYYPLRAENAKLDLVNGPKYKQLQEAHRKNAYRKYSNANMLSFSITGVGADKADRISFLMSVMMNEMMKTLFPYSYKCISVCPVLKNKDSIYNDEMGSKIKDAYPEIEVGQYYKAAPDSAEVFIVEDSETDTGMLTTLLQENQFPFAVFFETIYSYLTWMKKFEQKGNISNKYLYFGAAAAPNCFDFDTLLTLCSEFRDIKRQGPIHVDVVSPMGQCSYCGCDLYNVEYTEINDRIGYNNRKICSRCKKLVIKDERTLKRLYKEARQYLCSKFDIYIPSNIRVRFSTAEAIRRRLKTNDQRVVVGFADFANNELWVEADAPAPNVLDVFVHELTHFWQKENIRMDDLVYIEGHASYVEVQYLRSEHRDAFADWMEKSLGSRRDEYGEGFRRLRAELEERGDFNSFSYMLDLFGEGGSGRPGGGAPPPENPGDDPKGGFSNGSDEGTGIETDEGTGTGNDEGTGVGTDEGGQTGATGEESDTITGDTDIESTDTTEETVIIQRNPENVILYAYNTLSDENKAVYDLILEKIMEFEIEFTIPKGNNTYDDIYNALRMILYDHPEIFWINNRSCLTIYDYGTYFKVNPVYCLAREEAMERQKAIDNELPLFLKSITDTMSDYEVIRTVYDNIIALVDYDTVSLNLEDEEEDDRRKPDDLRSIYGMLVLKKGVCAGYAKAFQYLVNKLGFECVYVSGGEHAWNLLKLEGDYYHMDVTWGDGSNTEPSKNGARTDYEDFCITTEEIERDHTLDGPLKLPVCTAVKCNYHVHEGLFISEYSKEAVIDAVKKTFKRRTIKVDGWDIVTMKFPDEASLLNATQKMEKDVWDVIDELNRQGYKLRKSCSTLRRQERNIFELYLIKEN